jgi:hypothetical protein
MRTVLRFAALIIGVIGALDGLVVNVLVSTYHSVARALGGTVDPSHGVIGALLCLLAIVGAILALRTPLVGGILLLIAGFGLLFPLHWWALLAAPQIIIAGVLALADQGAQQAMGGMEGHPRNEPLPTS